MRHTAALAIMLLVGACGGSGIEGDASADGESDGTTTGECPPDLVECNGYCIDLMSNVSHCGECGTACLANEACLSGTCEGLCEEIEVSTAAELEERLSDLSWTSSVTLERYVTTTAGIDVAAADVGANTMFVSDLAGVHLTSEILYGFDESDGYPVCDFYRYPRYPSSAYESMSMDPDTSFSAGETTYRDGTGGSVGSCPSDLYCIGEFVAPSVQCCCTSEPFTWHVLEITEAPSVCFTGLDPCGSDFAGSDHSRCFDDYEDYVVGILNLDTECVDERGHVLVGGGCTCGVISGDVWMERDGTCTDVGTCDIEMSGMDHDPDPGCV